MVIIMCTSDHLISDMTRGGEGIAFKLLNSILWTSTKWLDNTTDNMLFYKGRVSIARPFLFFADVL